MAAPLDPAHLDHAIQLYLAGKPIQEILSSTSVSNSAFHRERIRRGIPPRRKIYLSSQEIRSTYLAGESELSIAERFNVSRSVVRRHLSEAGVSARGHSDAGRVRARRMTPDERLAQAAQAHRTTRGSTQPLERLERAAKSREARGLCDSPGELFLLGQLAVRGLVPTPQKAVGKYNLDMAVEPVAVEVLGGGWHFTKKTHAIRTPYILNAGWHLVFVWDHEGQSALTEHAADYIVSFLEQVRREPPAIGQYRVITGGGKLVAAGSADDDQFTLKPPPRGRLDSGS